MTHKRAGDSLLFDLYPAVYSSHHSEVHTAYKKCKCSYC